MYYVSYRPELVEYMLKNEADPDYDEYDTLTEAVAALMGGEGIYSSSNRGVLDVMAYMRTDGKTIRWNPVGR